MVYSVSGNIATITGQNGIYDKKITSSDVKYGRNAVANYNQYIKDIAKSPDLPPLQFEYRYIPTGNYSTQALMGNAYEELGKKNEVSVKELNEKLQSPELTAEALDLNNDGKVDIGEYATSAMAADMLDADQTKCDVKNLDGKITNKGENASMQLYTKQNVQNAKALFTEIHKNFNLDKAMNEFKANPNNTVE